MPALLLGLYAQFRVKSTYNKFSQIGIRAGYTGAQVARSILNQNGLHHIGIEQVGGTLSDHYDPIKKVLRLSNGVFSGRSIAAAGIAAHEVGHALQHSQKYLPLHLRTVIVPTVRLGSWLGPIMFMGGLFLEYLIAGSEFGFQIAVVGLILFSVTAIFSIITLPVEFNASKRARKWLTSTSMLSQDEIQGVNAILGAASLTYVAAAMQSVMTILYYSTLLFRRRR
jgi:Zn-dependent membrane protease YugP